MYVSVYWCNVDWECVCVCLRCCIGVLTYNRDGQNFAYICQIVYLYEHTFSVGISKFSVLDLATPAVNDGNSKYGLILQVQEFRGQAVFDSVSNHDLILCSHAMSLQNNSSVWLHLLVTLPHSLQVPKLMRTGDFYIRTSITEANWDSDVCMYFLSLCFLCSLFRLFSKESICLKLGYTWYPLH